MGRQSRLDKRAFAFAAATAIAATAAAQPAPPRRNLGHVELAVLGLAASVDPASPVVPKNTASAVRVVVRAGVDELSAAELARFLGPSFELRAELSGPGLRETLTLPVPPAEGEAEGGLDPLLLPLPPLSVAGDYALNNVRLLVGGQPVLDVAAHVPLQVIDQILVTSVKTRALTLDEIKAKGIVLDRDDYLGFEFTVGLLLESKAVNLSFPVVFDRRGVPIPQSISPPSAPPRVGVNLPPVPTIVPMLLEAIPEDESPNAPKPPGLKGPNGEPVRIPSVLVIPGNVGYLKQFFSAQLFVANGAPAGSGLVVRDVTGTVHLPAGADHEVGTADDPLALPETVNGPQPATLTVKGLGTDGAPNTGDDREALAPGEQGQAEFLIRGEREGFHTLDFDIKAVLDGLPVGPVKVAGTASGGVLVRNPFFDVTFTVPSVVRKGEKFNLFVTVTNIGQGIANDVSVTLDASRISGVRPLGEATLGIDTLRTGDARVLQFPFESQRTGQVVASYLHFDTQTQGGGSLKFTLGVGERGVPLSPDTLVLPAPVDSLPASVVDAAMRVLGQAWSVANAPAGTLPRGVIRTSKTVVTQKALALAEAGLRVTLGQPRLDAVRDVGLDFYGGELDPGFDQLLRETEAGHGLTLALGSALAEASDAAGGPTSYERGLARLAASGPDFISFAVSGPADVTILDRSGRRTAAGRSAAELPQAALPAGFILPLGPPADAPVLGVLARPDTSPYTIEIAGREAGTAELSVALPRGDGSVVHARLDGLTVAPGSHARLVLDLTQPESLQLEDDADGDGTFETHRPLATEALAPEGARLVSAAVIGPETLDDASPYGLQTALVFDRQVDPASAADTARYQIPNNAVRAARRQLSGRIVFAYLAQPEGPYVPTTLTAEALADMRGAAGPAATVTLQSRLANPGAVVSGRVLQADGRAVSSGVVTYSNNPSWTACDEYDYVNSGLAAVALGGDGRYEFRYVRQDGCGWPWYVMTNDPATGGLRAASGSVRAAGEQIVLDIVLFGRGGVTGIVRDLQGQPVAGAGVVAVSVTDPQIGGAATTDGDGRYEVRDITVGPITVTAVKGAGLGRSSGRIDRAGTMATVDVTVDGGSVRVSGTVRKLENGVASTVPGVAMVYRLVEGNASLPVGVTQTDSTGRYVFDGMPAGQFAVTADLNERDHGAIGGIAGAGDDLRERDIAIEIPSEDTGWGTVRGLVSFADGSPAPGVIVSINGRGGLSAEDGSFEIRGAPVLPFRTQHVEAVTRDGRRSGTAGVLVNNPGQIVEGVRITLSGIGAAEFRVFDAAGQPVANQEVALQGNCGNPCGCIARKTGGDGVVRFEGLPLGQVEAQAIRQAGGAVDVASGTASVTRDGATGFAILRFAGAGVVSGIVYDPDGRPAFGADLSLSSRHFVNDGESCGLEGGVSHRVRTDPTGRFRFSGVNVGPISLTASQPFFPTRVGAQGALTANGQQLDFTLSLVNTISGELSGTAYLPDGVSPAGAGVEVTANGALPDVTVSTDAQGRFRFAKIFPEGGYSITARDPVTGGVAQEHIYLRQGEDVVHDLRLKGRGTVRVRVVDGADHPVETAFVRLYETSFPSNRYEGAVEPAHAGVATFEQVFEGPLSVEASDAFARGGRTSSVLPHAGDTIEVKVALTVTGKVSGRYLMPDGSTPIPYATVRLIAGGRVVGQTTTTGTDPIGGYSFDFVPAGAVRLEAQDPLTARTGVAAGTLAGENQLLLLDVVAQGLGTVRGLVSGNGSPQPGAHVDVVSGSYRACTFSDGGGRYLVQGVPEGRVVVIGSLTDGFLSGTASATLSGDGGSLDLDVALRDSGQVDGTVVRADGTAAAPLSIVSLTVGGAGPGGSQSTSTDMDGRFHFDRVPAGQADVTVDVLGSIDRARGRVEVPPAGVGEIALRLNGVGSLSGRTLDSAGAPTAGSLRINGTGDFGYAFPLELDGSGVFALPEVLAGPFTASLQVRSGDFTLYGTASGEVHPDAPTEIDVQLQPSGTVTGLMLRADGSTPAVGTDVALQLDANRGEVRLQAQNDGRFSALGVPLGGFTLRASDPLTGGVGLVRGRRLDTNGQIADVGSIVLDDTPVAVVSVDPADGAGGVPVTQPVAVALSDPLASAAGITLRAGGAPVPASASLSEDGLTVTLSGSWPDSREIEVLVATSVRDVYGRGPAQAFSSRFRTVDLSPPVVAAVSPAAAAIQVPTAASIDVTFSEPLSEATDLAGLVTLTGPAGPVSGTTTRVSGAVVSFAPAGPLATDASYTVVVNGALDPSGNRQTVAFTSSFKTLDTVAPAVALTSPAAWSRTRRPAVSASFADALSGVDPATASLSLDGSTVAVSAGTGGFTFTPAADLAEGAHTIDVAVRDRAGNLGALHASFGIDVTPPSPAGVTGVSEGQLVRGVITLGGAASDTGSGVDRIELLRGDAVVLTALAPAFSAAYNTIGLAEGRQTFTARAVDAAGNVGPAGPPVTVIVDNQPLTVVISAPAAGARVGASVKIVALVSEPVAQVDFSAGAQTASHAAPPYEHTFDVSSSAEGALTVTARAVGLAGETASATRTVTVDHTPPAPPDSNRISAEDSENGTALVLGRSAAVEAQAQVEATDLDNDATGTAAAAGDGSFALGLASAANHTISLIAIDAVGNRSAATAVVVQRKQTLGGIPSAGLRLWVKADAGVTRDGSDRVSRWEDQSGKGNHLVQNTAAAQPQWTANVAGSLPALHFDGANDLLGFTTRLTTVRTVFWVIREDAAATNEWRPLLGDSFNPDFHGGYPTIWADPYTNAAIRNGQTWLNGAPINGTTTNRPRSMSVISVVTTANVSADNFAKQPSYSRYWWGDLAELIVYDQPLTAPDRKTVEDYLALKYALYVPTAGTPTISPPGGTFEGSTTVSLATSTTGGSIYYTTDGSEPTTSSTPYDGPFTIATTTTLKAKAFRPGLNDSGTATVTFMSADDFAPSKVGGLKLWVRADAGAAVDAADRVSTLSDQSGQNNHLVQALPFNQPRLVANAAGGLPALHFDGGDDLLGFTTRLTTVRTVFWVIREDAAATYEWRPLLGDSFNPDFHGGYTTIWADPYTNPAVRNGQTWLNGAPINGTTTSRPRSMSVISVVTTANLSADNFAKQPSYSRYWWGDLAELIVYDQPLSATDRKAVENYLAEKYGLYTPSAATPVVTPAGGTFTGTATVTLATTPGATVYYTTDGSEPTTSSTPYGGAFVLDRTTVVKAKAFGDGIQDSGTTTVTFLSADDFSPSRVAGLKLWVRADAGAAVDAAGRVSALSDQSGQGNHLGQALPFNQPRLVADAAGGLPALHFDGGDDLLGFTTRLTTVRTVFWVVREDAAATYEWRPLLGDSFNPDFHGGYTTIWADPYTNAAVRNGQTWLNGAVINGLTTSRPRSMSVISVVTTANVSADNFAKQPSYSRYWWGDLAELIVYDQPLSVTDRKAVEDYLALKYGLYTPSVAAPAITPPGGIFVEAPTVSLTTSSPSATIFYTLDGTNPTGQSTRYTTPFAVTTSTTVTAIALQQGVASPVSSARFWRRDEFAAYTALGRVVDGAGNPAAGLVVTCGSFTGQTAADGTFVVTVGQPGTVTCETTKAVGDGTSLRAASAAVPLSAEGPSDAGTILLGYPTYYGYNPQDGARLLVTGWTNGTTYRLYALEDGHLVTSGTVNRYETRTVSLTGIRHFKLETTSPVQATFGYDCCNVGGSFFYPAADGARLVGRQFVIRIPVLSGNNEFVVFAYEPATVTIRNTAGGTVFTRVMAAGESYSTTGSPLGSGTVYQVDATGDVSLMSNALNGYAAVPARDGTDVGTEFLAATSNYVGNGAVALFAYDDATVTATALAGGAVVFTQTLHAGEFAYVSGLPGARLKLSSTGRIGVWAGSTQGGNAIRWLGDDVTLNAGAGGRDVYFHTQSGGASVLALEPNTHVVIDGTAYTLQAGQFVDLPADAFGHLTSDRPVVVETIGGNSLDDWECALRLVVR